MSLNWVSVTKGYLTLWHRPALKSMPELVQANCTHVVTLLSENEGAIGCRANIVHAGMASIWLPMPSIKRLDSKIEDSISACLPDILSLLRSGAKVLIHCSAGIHRTGIIAYALLRFHRYSREETLNKIALARIETFDGLREQYIEIGERLALKASKKLT